MRKYTEEEKLAAVKRTLAGGGSELQTHVADSLGMPESTLRGWIFVWKRQQRELRERLAAEENARAAPASTIEEEKTPKELERDETPTVLGYVIVCQIVWLTAPTEEATPKAADPGEASPSTSHKPEAAREPKGRRRAAPSSSSARKERASEKVCPVEDASRKRKRQGSGPDAEPRPNRTWRSRRLHEAEERRRAADLLNAPEEPCKYKTVLESVGLVRRPDAVDLPPLE